MSLLTSWTDRALALRYRWTFEWAHHPLCTRFERDVLRLGSLHLCRSCTALAFGFVATGLAWAFAPPLPYPVHVGLVLGAALLLVPLGNPRWHARLPRLARDLTRGATGALIASVLAFLPLGRPLAALALGLPLVFATAWLIRRRSLARASRCNGCVELGRGVCSGYRHQAERLRVWEERAAARLTHRLVHSGSVPGRNGGAPHGRTNVSPSSRRAIHTGRPPRTACPPKTRSERHDRDRPQCP